jgi:hypothetical protein
VAELDDFVARWASPLLAARGYRKSRLTYRKQYRSGAWSVLSFRARPTGILGRFLADASFVPGPLFDWFRFRSPDLAGDEPTGWWLDWGTPLRAGGGNTWEYDSEGQREDKGILLGERLAEVVDRFDEFGVDDDALVRLVLDPERFTSEALPLFHTHLRRGTYRASVLIGHGPSTELDEVLDWSDDYPALRLREWADHYRATH